MRGMGTRRLFAGVAIETTEALRRLLGEWKAGLEGERIRWVQPANLHITVEFFGAVEEGRLPELENALAAAAGRASAFRLALGGAGVFGGMRHPRVLWLGVESAGLAALHGQVADALREAGWEAEGRPYAPHLTLGRIGGLKDVRRFRELVERNRNVPAGEQGVDELVLLESVAGRYVPVRTWGLGR